MKNPKSTQPNTLILRTKNYVTNMDPVTLFASGMLTAFTYMGIFNFLDGVSAVEVFLYQTGLMDLQDYKFAISLIPVFIILLTSSYLSFKSVIKNAALLMIAAFLSAIILTAACYYPMAALSFAFNIGR